VIMKYYCIGDADTVLGFRLTGVEGAAVSNSGEAAAAFTAAAERPDIGVIMMTAGAASLIRAQVDQLKLERSRPLIVEM